MVRFSFSFKQSKSPLYNQTLLQLFHKQDYGEAETSLLVHNYLFILWLLHKMTRSPPRAPCHRYRLMLTAEFILPIYMYIYFLQFFFFTFYTSFQSLWLVKRQLQPYLSGIESQNQLISLFYTYSGNPTSSELDILFYFSYYTKNMLVI